MIDDLPADDPERLAMARPWRQRAWERVPGWARIGLISLLAMLALNVLLAIRIWYGVQDPPEVAAIRGPGRHIIIPATNRTFRSPLDWIDAAPIGLRGTSTKDVIAVRLDEHTTDELVTYIAKHFPNVQELYFSHGNVTTKGLLALKNCPQIESLDISDTDVSDGIGELLPHLPKLMTLIAMNTELGDEFTIAAAKHESLEYCAMDGTNITAEAQSAWKALKPKTRIQTDFDRYVLRGLIRWENGETSRKFNGPYELGHYGPERTGDPNPWSCSSTSTSTGLRADRLRWSPQEFHNEQDGRYQFRLKLGEFEAEPAEFELKDGKPSVDRVEFRMSVTRTEAERAVVREQQ